MCRRPKLAALHDDEQHCADDGNEVERQVHEVADYRLGREFGERLRHNLTQLGDRVVAGLDLALVRDQRRQVAVQEGLLSVNSTLSGHMGKTYAIEGVDESLIDQKVLAQDRKDRRALAEDEQNSGEERKRAIENCEDGGLRDIGYGKHQHRHTEAERDGREKLVGQWLPQVSVGEEVHDALSTSQLTDRDCTPYATSEELRTLMG